MPATLNNEEIALMCDIAQSSDLHLTPHKMAELHRLRAAGYIKMRIAPTASENLAYELTREGRALLDELGVGADES